MSRVGAPTATGFGRNALAAYRKYREPVFFPRAQELSIPTTR
jgi:hypothetical protein